MTTDAKRDSETRPTLQTSRFPTPPERTTTRRLLVVLLDVSYSMGESSTSKAPIDGQPDPGTPIAELNAALHQFTQAGGIQIDDFADNGEIAIGAFSAPNHKAQVIWLPLGTPVREGSKIHWARHVRPSSGSIEADGGTPLGMAVGAALDVINERVAELALKKVRVTPRPVLVVLTDGKPTDDISRATQRVHQMEEASELLMWVAGMAGSDPSQLGTLADKGNYIPLADKPIGDFIRFLSASVDVAGKNSRRTAREIYDSMNRKWRTGAPRSSDVADS